MIKSLKLILLKLLPRNMIPRSPNRQQMLPKPQILKQINPAMILRQLQRQMIMSNMPLRIMPQTKSQPIQILKLQHRKKQLHLQRLTILLLPPLPPEHKLKHKFKLKPKLKPKPPQVNQLKLALLLKLKLLPERPQLPLPPLSPPMHLPSLVQALKTKNWRFLFQVTNAGIAVQMPYTISLLTIRHSQSTSSSQIKTNISPTSCPISSATMETIFRALKPSQVSGFTTLTETTNWNISY